MGHFYFEKGLVIRRLGQYWEFASRCGEDLYFENPESGKRETLLEPQFWMEQKSGAIKVLQAFSSPKMLLLPEQPDVQQLTTLDDLPECHQLETVRRHTYLTRLRDAGLTKGQKRLITIEAAKIARDINDKFGVPSESTLRRWWRIFEKEQFDVFVLVSKNAHRRTPQKLDEDSERYLQQRIDQDYLKDTRPSVATAYRDYADSLELENQARTGNGLKPLTAISERTYYNRVSALPQEDVLIARLGRESARRAVKMIKGHLPGEYPLDFVEMDHSPMNLYVIDDVALLPLGRPWLTVIKDRFSGILLGFYVSFHQTGLPSVFGAIKHSLQSHHFAYEHWPDLENPWPAHGCGVRYVSDRGADFMSQRYRNAILSLGARYEYCERRTPWLKGSVERFFLTLEQTFFEAMPGRTFASLAVRGDYDPSRDAVVRFSTLIFLLHKWAVDYHNVLPNKRKQATPLQLWTDGIGVAPPPYPACVDSLDIVLGQRYSGSLSHEGVRFKWLNYADETLAEILKIIGPGNKVDFVVSAEDLGAIHVRHPLNGEYLKVPCTRPEYARGLSLFQHAYLRKEAGERLRAATAIDTLMSSRRVMANRIAEEIDAKENKAKARLAQIAGVNSNAILQGERKTILQPFQGQEVGITETERSAIPAITDIPRYAWGT